MLVTDAVYNLGMAAFQGGNFARARPAFEEALELARELDEAPWVGAAQFMLGQLDLSSGDHGSAQHRAREALSVYTRLEDDRSRARCLVVLAGAATEEGMLEDAARYLGAGEALRGDQTPDSFELPLFDRYVPQLEAAMGDQRFSELKAEGAQSAPGAVMRQVVSSGIEE